MLCKNNLDETARNVGHVLAMTTTQAMVQSDDYNYTGYGPI